MTAASHSRGHPTYWDGSRWRYADTGEVDDGLRACVLCHLPPTPEGYDACLGHIPGASSACCGHGVRPPFLILAVNEARGVEQDHRVAAMLDGALSQADRAAMLARLARDPEERQALGEAASILREAEQQENQEVVSDSSNGSRTEEERP